MHSGARRAQGESVIEYRIPTSAARRTSAAGQGWTRQQLPAAAGDCRAQRIDVDNGLSLVHTRYLPVNDLIEESANADGPGTLIVTLGLAGDSAYCGRDGSRLGFRAGHTTVSSFRHAAGERRYRAGAAVAQLRILVGEAMLQRYLGEADAAALLPGAGVRQLAFGKTSTAGAAHGAALQRLVATQTDDVLTLQIHVLSLLAEQLRGLRPPAAAAPLSRPDIDKLERMRALMQAQMARPLTLDYLCAAVGLSQFKLKEGCRHLYNSSPHRMLLEMRMRRAWTLLEGGCQVAQAAWQVGYAHPSNFSAAFAKFFGRTPKSIFGRRH